MPYPTEHAARLADPSKFRAFTRKVNGGGPGIDFIIGWTGDQPGRGESEIQAVRFATDKFTDAQAKQWMTDHMPERKVLQFEPAQSPSDNPIAEANLMVKSATVSNGRFYYELVYALDTKYGAAEYNLRPIRCAVDSDRPYKDGCILKVAFAGAEPVAVAPKGKYGVELVNAAIVEENTGRKSPDSAKDIFQKADYVGCLLASEPTMTALVEGGMIRKRETGRSVSVTSPTTGNSGYGVDYRFPLLKDDTKRLVYGVVYEPFDGSNADTQGDFASAEEIEKAAHAFMDAIRAGNGGNNLMHELPIDGKAKVVESYIALQDMWLNGDLIKKGSWVLVTHVPDPELWQMIQSGELTGYSMEGTGKSSDLFKSAKPVKDVIEKRCLFDMVITAVALVDRGANRKKFFLMKRSDTMNKDTILLLVKAGKFTAEQATEICKSAKLSETETAEIVKAATPAETPAPALTVEALAAEIKKANDALTADMVAKLSEALVKAVTGALEKFSKAEPPPAPETKDAAWYVAHPDEEVPEDMIEAVMALIAEAEANK